MTGFVFVQGYNIVDKYVNKRQTLGTEPYLGAARLACLAEVGGGHFRLGRPIQPVCPSAIHALRMRAMCMQHQLPQCGPRHPDLGGARVLPLTQVTCFGFNTEFTMFNNPQPYRKVSMREHSCGHHRIQQKKNSSKWMSQATTLLGFPY
jgi:hypothetical protein